VHPVDRPRASRRSRLDHGPARAREPLAPNDLDERSPFRPTRESTDGIEQRLEPHAPLLGTTDKRRKVLCEHAEFLRMLAADPPQSGCPVEPTQESWIRSGIRRWRRRGAEDRCNGLGRQRIRGRHASDKRLAHEKRACAIEIDIARVDRCSDTRTAGHSAPHTQRLPHRSAALTDRRRQRRQKHVVIARHLATEHWRDQRTIMPRSKPQRRHCLACERLHEHARTNVARHSRSRGHGTAFPAETRKNQQSQRDPPRTEHPKHLFPLS
jgi:hypothetical protein